ncbi:MULTISPECIES: PEP/pyruvate-binding domain-containing protein [unclassified Endozoicomonas]|uniref:PEP/pyruvate-binding domain-containing protein n=1 Tax=unclassified Endozoicomonas TaxID=2644528 RepID=UPI003BB71953
MLDTTFLKKTDPQSPATHSNQINGAYSSPKRHFGNVGPGVVVDPTPMAERSCRSPAADCSPCDREQLGGKGMFLWRMKKAGLSVPAFECVTAQVMNALEQQPLDSHRLDPYLPEICCILKAEPSLTSIRECLNALPPSEQTIRNHWLAGLEQFIASDDYYQQVKDSEAAEHIRGLCRQLHRTSESKPVIVRSSGINEDNYGDAQAGKYRSEVQGEEDIVRTCLKIMASAYRPEVCSEGVPSPMPLVIQQCIDCKYGGVAMSFQSFEDGTIRVEYTKGQPKGVVAGQSGNTPHRIDIYRGDSKEETKSFQFFPGKISSHFILHKDNNGYSETRIDDGDSQSNDVEQQLTDGMISDLREMVTKLEKLLLCPVDVEFAIDHQGRLLLLQVRPVTRLSGGLDFAMPIPEETLAIGEGVSEGYCTGPLWLAQESAADSMPEGAIVVARHAQDWMLEPGFLKRAGGFVTATGGFNDHVAILMKQQRKTLMLAGGEFATVVAQVGQKATLACARFNGKPGAFIVVGDMTGKLVSHQSLSSAGSDVPSTKAAPSWDDLSLSEGALRQVASGFQWLTDQNARLLAFFASGGGLDCLANPVKLSMSPQRSKRLAETCDSVNLLVHGAEALLDGYGVFLQLAGERRSHSVVSLQDEVPQLINRFEKLKKTIQSGLKRITLPMQASDKGQLSPGIFHQWVADCYQLQSCLQALSPGKAEWVRSVHELIFALHQRFVKALGQVTLDSGQGRLSKINDITYADCTTWGEEAPLLSPTVASINELKSEATVVSMDDAFIVTLDLGDHKTVIELFEHAEGGKGRTVRLKFSDKFYSPDGSDAPGKLKRMWFLARLLKAIELDKNADAMKLSCNVVVGEIIVECARMPLVKTRQDIILELMTTLKVISNLDLYLNGKVIFERDQWNFNLLEQRLNGDVTTETDRFVFQQCLFVLVHGTRNYITEDCYRLLANPYQQFIDQARRLAEYDCKPVRQLREVLMNDKIADDTRRKLFHHLLTYKPSIASQLTEDVYPHLRGKYFVVEPSQGYELRFAVSPDQPLWRQNREKVEKALLKHEIEHASQRVRKEYWFLFDR